VKDQFRLLLISHDELATMQAIPLGAPSPAGDTRVFPRLRGKKDLMSFILHVGIDSIVQTRQIGRPEQLGESNPPALERTFNLLHPKQIMRAIGRRFATNHDDISLGSTKLSPSEGLQRITDWTAGHGH
jgi:hypothetical protein